MSGFLELMADRSRQRVEAARASMPIAELVAVAADASKPLHLIGFDLIAEVKRTSPSAGVLEREGLDVLSQARQYASAGAAMISVLTEPSRFRGSGEDLRAIAATVSVPVMRKDFLVDPYQVLEGRAWGASAVLLIARMLDDNALARMLDSAAEARLTVLLEAFDARDLDRSIQAIAGHDHVLVGLNCRDLATLREDTGRFDEFVSSFPRDAIKIAESGIVSVEDAARVARLGYDGVLVGTALMRADDPERLARDMIDAGRSIRA